VRRYQVAGRTIGLSLLPADKDSITVVLKKDDYFVESNSRRYFPIVSSVISPTEHVYAYV